MDYLSYLGFKEHPFRLTPDQEFFFPGINHRELEAVIEFGIDEGEGFIIIVGEVGTGKTMLIRHLTSRLSSQYETALILSPLLKPRELIMAILRDIGLLEKNDKDSGLDNLLFTLNNHLYELAKKGKRLIVIVDEAHDMLSESIEQLRLLSNFESDKQKWLQIIMVGQPELQAKIEHPSLRQLLQRVTILETLRPLSRNELGLYVHYRLEKAGRGDMKLNKSALRALWKYSKGVPRLINKIMNRTLLIACSHEMQQVTSKCIHEAVGSFDRRIQPKFSRNLVRWILPFVLALAGGLYFYTSPDMALIFNNFSILF